jgi:hypothetical protein
LNIHFSVKKKVFHYIQQVTAGNFAQQNYGNVSGYHLSSLQHLEARLLVCYSNLNSEERYQNKHVILIFEKLNKQNNLSNSVQTNRKLWQGLILTTHSL